MTMGTSCGSNYLRNWIKASSYCTPKGLFTSHKPSLRSVVEGEGYIFFALGFLHDAINPCEQQQKKKQGGSVTYIDDQEDEVINPLTPRSDQHETSPHNILTWTSK